MRIATNREFPAFDATSAPTAARAGIAAVQAQLGFVPAPIARYALSPAFLRMAQQSLHAFETTSLSPVEREVVAFAVIRRNQCGFCTSFHRAVTLPRLGLSASEIDAIVAGDELKDERLDALRQFAEAMLEGTGDVDDASFDRFLSAGFDRAQALEVVLGIGAYTMTTFGNRLTQVAMEASS